MVLRRREGRRLLCNKTWPELTIANGLPTSDDGDRRIVANAGHVETVKSDRSARDPREGDPGFQVTIIPFYKKGCQDKCLPCDGKTQGAGRPAPVIAGRDSVVFPFPTDSVVLSENDALRFLDATSRVRLCSANHSSI